MWSSMFTAVTPGGQEGANSTLAHRLATVPGGEPPWIIWLWMFWGLSQSRNMETDMCWWLVGYLTKWLEDVDMVNEMLNEMLCHFVVLNFLAQVHKEACWQLGIRKTQMTPLQP